MASLPNPMLGGGGDPSASQAGAGIASTVMGALANKSQNPGQDFSQQSAALQGADPTMILRQIEQIQSLLGVLFVKTFQTYPNGAQQISKWMTQGTRVIKEFQQAANVGEAVKGAGQAQQPQPPITFSAAMQGDNSQPEGGLRSVST